MIEGTPTLDFGSIQRELIVAIRGKLSQKQLNEKLKFKTNRIHKWESGELSISWSEFNDLCAVRELPLAEACKQKLQFAGEIKNVSALVTHLTGSVSQETTAKFLGVSRSMVSRWRAGKVEPTLETIFRLIHLSFYSLSMFLSSLVGSERLPSLRNEFEKEKYERDLHVKYPWIAALLLWLRTVEYNDLKKHRTGFLAKKLGISEEEEKKIFNELISIGAIEPEGAIYAPRARTINTTSDFESDRKIRQYWTQRCAEYQKTLKGPKPRNGSSYMVLNTNPESVRRIKDRYNEFYQDVHKIIMESRVPSDSVYLMNFQLINLEDLPG